MTLIESIDSTHATSALLYLSNNFDLFVTLSCLTTCLATSVLLIVAKAAVVQMSFIQVAHSLIHPISTIVGVLAISLTILCRQVREHKTIVRGVKLVIILAISWCHSLTLVINLLVLQILSIGRCCAAN